MYTTVIIAAFDEKWLDHADLHDIIQEGFRMPTAAHHQGAVMVFVFTFVRHSCPSSLHVTVQAITP